MNKILALREKRANLWNETKAFLDSHRGEDGMVSAEDNATYEKMEADVVALGKEIERLERQAAIDREMDQPTASPLVSRPVAPNDRPPRPNIRSRCPPRTRMNALTAWLSDTRSASTCILNVPVSSHIQRKSTKGTARSSPSTGRWSSARTICRTVSMRSGKVTTVSERCTIS